MKNVYEIERIPGGAIIHISPSLAGEVGLSWTREEGLKVDPFELEPFLDRITPYLEFSPFVVSIKRLYEEYTVTVFTLDSLKYYLKAVYK